MKLTFRPKSGLIILIQYIILSTLFCNVKAICEGIDKDLKEFCVGLDKIKFNKWDPDLRGAKGELASNRPELRCANLSCFCPAVNGKKDGSVNGCILPNGKQLGKCIRQEFRMLTDEQREAYFKTIKEMKANKDFDMIALLHLQAWEEGGAHRGPQFLVFHREMLKVFELAMREASYKILQSTDVCLPYWDSTMDGSLPTPKDSYFFTADFIGSTNATGQVIDGPFSPWETLMNTEYIKRDVGKHGSCYKEEYIKWQMNQTKIENIIAYTSISDPGKCPTRVYSGNPELAHGGPHTFIGGNMGYITESANDPVFYNHHCFVDYLFEQWRKANQNYSQRPVQYPVDNPACETDVHYRNEKMTQFPVICFI
uniref:Tyrosinase copper-binding domain-containing protein n=1 Tax=Meloidogyne incognita TaxID=6306 RepID=A0A914LB60_MELIC